MQADILRSHLYSIEIDIIIYKHSIIQLVT